MGSVGSNPTVSAVFILVGSILQFLRRGKMSQYPQNARPSGGCVRARPIGGDGPVKGMFLSVHTAPYELAKRATGDSSHEHRQYRS